MQCSMNQEIAELIRNISQAGANTTSMQELIAAIRIALSQVMDTTNFYVTLYDAQKDTMKFAYHVDEMDSIEDYDQEYYDRYCMENISHLEGYTPEVIRTGKPLLIHREENAAKNDKITIKQLGTPSKVWLGVPLKIKNNVMGVLAVQSYVDAERYGAREMEILVAVSDQIVLAIEHKRLDEAQKRNEEIKKTLFSIANAVNVTLNLRELYRFIHMTLSRVMTLPNFYIALYDKEKGLIKFPYAVDEKDYPDRREFSVEIKTLKKFSLTLTVIETRKTLLINKKRILQLSQESHKELWGPVAEAWFGVPLLIRNEVMGVMCAQSYDESFRFNENDLEILKSVSDQVAIAIDRKRADEEAQKRAERLTVLNRIGKVAAIARNLDQLMESIYEEINQIFRPDCFFIGFIDHNSHALDFRFLIENGKRESGVKLHLDQGYSSKVIHDKKPLIILDGEKQHPSLPEPLKFGNLRASRSWVGVPLMYEEQVIGIISLQSYQPNAWNEEDLQLFFTIADQITATIQKARLYESVQQELNERKKAEEAKKDLETRLRQAQKMEAIGTLAGGIAHDFNNVLYPIIGYTEMTMDRLPPDSPTRKNLEEVLIASERAKDMVQQILAFSRQQEYQPHVLKVQPILKEALKLIRTSIPSTITIVQTIPESCGPIMADPSQVHQIIMNLCTNAYHAMRKQGGTLEVGLAEVAISPENLVKPVPLLPGLYLCLTVRDTGHGIDPFIRDRIFDPYFTTKAPGEGTGMGLAMVHGMVKSFGGEITVSSQPGQGACFQVFLPRIMAPETPADVTMPKGIPGRDEWILFVDDEAQIANMLEQMLLSLGYQVIVKTNSSEALDAFRADPGQFDLVMTDQTMPGLTGFDLAKRMLEIRPGMPIMLCTGHSDLVNEELVQAAGIRKLIYKPISKNQLSLLMRELLDK